MPEKYITDGPFVIKEGDELICIWSTIINGSYKQVVARSENGKIYGKWTMDEKSFCMMMTVDTE